VKELCSKHGFSEASFYPWRSKFSGMDVSDVKRLKSLEVENARQATDRLLGQQLGVRSSTMRGRRERSLV